jgi:hypothetical protein
VTNENDSKAMGGMLRRIKPFWGTMILWLLRQRLSHRAEFDAIDSELMSWWPFRCLHTRLIWLLIEHFKYNKETDTYTCQQMKLT